MYALASLGVALVFGVMGMINFAHGAFIMVGVYLLVALTDLGVVPAIIIVLALVVLLALATERIAFKPVRQADASTMLVTSFAIAFLIQNVVILVEGTQPKSASFLASLSKPLRIGEISIPLLDVLIIATSALLVAALAVFLRKMSIGVQMRAAASDFDTARLLGVRANRVIALAFGISGLLAAVVSVFYLAKNGSATPTVGIHLVLIAFMATVIGGLGSLSGAAIAGFGVGVGSVLLENVLPESLRNYTLAFVCALVVLVLLLRPQGIMGDASRWERV